MKIIEGTGAPSRKTVGALGDIYKDTTTGKRYKCIFAYRESLNDAFDCQWKEIDGTDAVKVEEMVAEPIVNPEAVKEEPKKPEPVEQNDQNKPQKGKRTNYTQYSKNAK